MRPLISRSRFFASLALIAVWCATFAPVVAVACPFCGPPSMTLTEQLSKADAAVLVEWTGGTVPKDENAGTTTFAIVEVARAPSKSVAKGKKIVLDRYRAGKAGDLALIVGSRTKGELIEWGSPIDVSKAVYRYIIEAPPAEAPANKRLSYFMQFLEHADATISADAYTEFANADYKEIVGLTKELPREKLREWVSSKETSATRLGLYGLMLGLCGNSEDASLMEQRITENVDDFRIGIDGVIGGYLLLTGESGLAVIEKSKLLDKKAPFSETFAAMQALRFLWTYGGGRIPPERLKSSMRLLLDRPELADLVISDLARWKDWSQQEKVMQMYGTEDFNVPGIKRAIIRYMIASTKDTPGGGAAEPPEHVVSGTKYLKQLRDKDAKMVNEAERFFFLN